MKTTVYATLVCRIMAAASFKITTHPLTQIIDPSSRLLPLFTVELCKSSTVKIHFQWSLIVTVSLFSYLFRICIYYILTNHHHHHPFLCPPHPSIHHLSSRPTIVSFNGISSSLFGTQCLIYTFNLPVVHYIIVSLFVHLPRIL